MAFNQLARRIQLLIEKAIREECFSGSCNEGLAKTPDLNLPPANLSSFGGPSVDMKMFFNDEGQATCHVCGTRKRTISGFTENPRGDMANSGFILESSSKSNPPDSGFIVESSSKSNPPEPEYLQYLNKILFGYDGTEDLPSLVCMGCVRCYMYVMVSERAPKCPNCKSGTDLLDIATLNDQAKKKARRN